MLKHVNVIKTPIALDTKWNAGRTLNQDVVNVTERKEHCV